MTNTLDFILTNSAGNTYNISNVNSSQEFEIWIDNRNVPSDTNYLQQVGTTALPPSPMNGYLVTVPQNADLFVNVLHLIKRTSVDPESFNGTINYNNGTDNVKILYNNYYSGQCNKLLIIYF